jgi:hypothetical protein
LTLILPAPRRRFDSFSLIKPLILMLYSPKRGRPRRALGFVALQRKTADNFRLAMRAALRNLDFVRR